MATATVKKPKEEFYSESFSTVGQSLKVDRENHVVRGVKLHGLISENGREYTPGALRDALHFYEGAKVNIDHPDKANLNAPRGVGDRAGRIRGAHFIEGQGNFGDWHYNPKHALIEQILWDAEHEPENVGFSPVLKGRLVVRNGRSIVEAIQGVRSLDLVADPATTKGLFEQTDIEEQDMLESFTLDDLKTKRPDLVQAIIAEQKDGDDLVAKDRQIKTLREQVDLFETEKKLRDRQAAVDAKLSEAKLPDALVTEVFLESCYEADDARLVKLIEDRKSLVGNMSNGKMSNGNMPNGERRSSSKPLSKDQTALSESVSYPDQMETKEFVAALRR